MVGALSHHRNPAPTSPRKVARTAPRAPIANETSRERGKKLFLPVEKGGEGYVLALGNEPGVLYVVTGPHRLKDGGRIVREVRWFNEGDEHPLPTCAYSLLKACEAWEFYGTCCHIEGIRFIIYCAERNPTRPAIPDAVPSAADILRHVGKANPVTEQITSEQQQPRRPFAALRRDDFE